MKSRHWWGFVAASVLIVVIAIIFLYRNSNKKRIESQIKDVNVNITSSTLPDDLIKFRLQEKALLNQLG